MAVRLTPWKPSQPATKSQSMRSSAPVSNVTAGASVSTPCSATSSASKWMAVPAASRAAYRSAGSRSGRTPSSAAPEPAGRSSAAAASHAMFRSSWTWPSASRRAPSPGRAQRLHRAPLEDAGAHPLEDVAPAAQLERRPCRCRLGPGGGRAASRPGRRPRWRRRPHLLPPATVRRYCALLLRSRGDHRLPRSLHDDASGGRRVAGRAGGGRRGRSRHVGEKGTIDMSDDEIRDSLETNQLRLQRERGTDLTIFSPRAIWMGHHVGNEHTSEVLDASTRTSWSTGSATCTPTTSRRCASCPSRPVRPSTPASPSCVGASRRWGSSGATSTPIRPGATGPGRRCRTVVAAAVGGMCELDVPAMIHVSAACNPHFHTTGSHYLGADTTAFMQALTSGFLRDFPGLRWVIPHGGGAVPYHWGRFKGMAEATTAGTSTRVDASTSSSTHASTTSPASTCSSTSSRPRTSCSRRRCSGRCAASTRPPATTTTTPGATSTRRPRPTSSGA